MRASTLVPGLQIILAVLVGYLFAVFLPTTAPPDFDMTNIAPLRLQKAVNLARGFANSAVFLQKPLTSATPCSPINSQANSATSTFTHNFSTTNTAKMDMSFKDAVVHRRTVYQLTQKSPIDDSKIKQIAEAAVKHVPSSFNSQSTRIVVLLKEEHNKFWGIVESILKGIVPEDSWGHTAQRINGFKSAYGSVSATVASHVKRATR